MVSPRSREGRFAVHPLWVLPFSLDRRWLAHVSNVDSGHGGQSPDASGRELDGMDETIFPVDFDQEGDIIDDVRVPFIPF